MVAALAAGAPGAPGGSATSATVMVTGMVTSTVASAAPAASLPSLTFAVTAYDVVPDSWSSTVAAPTVIRPADEIANAPLRCPRATR